MPLWVGDFLSSASCAELSGEEQALYLLLLVHCWNMGECGLPTNRRELKRLAKLELRMSYARVTKVLRMFYVRDTRYFHARIDDELLKVRERSKKASLSAKARWEKIQRLKILGS